MSSQPRRYHPDIAPIFGGEGRNNMLLHLRGTKTAFSLGDPYPTEVAMAKRHRLQIVAVRTIEFFYIRNHGYEAYLQAKLLGEIDD